MADDSDEEQQKRIIENQPYDETLEVPDGEDVASIYTPTPRHQRNQQSNYNKSQLYPQQQIQKNTPPPTSSSVSSGSYKNENFYQKEQKNSNKPNMSEPQSPVETPKPKPTRDNSINDSSEIRHSQIHQNALFYNNTTGNIVNTSEYYQPEQDEYIQTSVKNNNNKSNYKTPMSTPSLKPNYDEDTSSPRPEMEDEIKPKKMQQDMGDSGSEANESDESQENYNDLPGAYDPAAFRDLPVSSEIKDIFKFIERYQPQNIELDFKLKPFIPDYIPSIGDIDAFIKIPRPDGKQDNLGLIVVDEPSSNQSDPHVLDLFFRTLSKQTTEVAQPSTVKSVEGNNTKAIDSWIRNISALQKNKPVQSVNYQRAMPSIDSLMQVWPNEFEELLKEVSLPSAELNVDLKNYTDIICALLDIPVYKSRVQSIHVLFSLFSEFKNSEHFKNPNQTINPYPSSNYKPNDTYGGKSGNKGSDRLVIE